MFNLMYFYNYLQVLFLILVQFFQIFGLLFQPFLIILILCGKSRLSFLIAFFEDIHLPYTFLSLTIKKLIISTSDFDSFQSLLTSLINFTFLLYHLHLLI